MTLKVSNTLNYLVGFNVFPSVNATSIVASGDSTQLTWVISDIATYFALSALSFAAIGLLV